MTITIDKTIYPDSCISKAIYHLSGRFSFERKGQGNVELLTIHEKGNTKMDESLFWDTLNDFKLRDIISRETKDIRTILFAKAFADFDNLSEDDFE
jgi:His-Xaa-Ser system protein HxsD